MKLFATIFFTIMFSAAMAQKNGSSAYKDSSFVLVKIYHGEIANVALDYLDNLYVISFAGQVKKFSSAGDSLAVYNQIKNYGKLVQIDVSNPLRPLLFYQDFATVVILDRFLAQRSVLDLKKFNILQPAAIGLSYDNNIWVFDEYDSRLKKIDEQGNILFQSADFRTIFANTISPQKIINDDGFVYLADSAKGVFVFDNYGTFKRQLPLKSWSSIAFAKDIVFTASKDHLVLYQPSTFKEIKKPVSQFQPYLHSFITGNRFVVFTNDTLRIYHFRF